MNDTPTRTASSSRRLLPLDEVAQLVGVSPRHYQRLAERGAAPGGVYLGACRRWDSVELAEWIATGCPPVKSTEPEGTP